MQQPRHREDPAAIDLVFHHSNMADMSRRCGNVDSHSFAIPLVSAFRNFHKQHGRDHQQHGCDISYRDTQDQTGVSDDDDDCNSRGTDHGVEVDGIRSASDSSGRRAGYAVCHDVSAGSHGGSASQRLTSRKHDYSVAELLRNDRPSSSTTDQPHAGASDSHRHDEAETSPSQTIDSAFHGWNVEQVDRLTAPLPLPLPLYTTHHHPWTERMLLDSCRRTECDNQAQQRFFGIFDTPPLNFMSTYENFRRDAEHMPFSTFGQEYSIQRRSRTCTFCNMLSQSLCNVHDCKSYVSR